MRSVAARLLERRRAQRLEVQADDAWQALVIPACAGT